MIPAENPALLEKIAFSSSGSGYHGPVYGHSSSGFEHYPKKGKKSIALSALTLLAFLFFLHILSTCIQDHISSLNTQVVVIPTIRSQQKVNPDRKQKGDTEPEPLSSEENDGSDEYHWIETDFKQNSKEKDSKEAKGEKVSMYKIRTINKHDNKK